MALLVVGSGLAHPPQAPREPGHRYDKLYPPSRSAFRSLGPRPSSPTSRGAGSRPMWGRSCSARSPIGDDHGQLLPGTTRRVPRRPWEVRVPLRKTHNFGLSYHPRTGKSGSSGDGFLFPSPYRRVSQGGHRLVSQVAPLLLGHPLPVIEGIISADRPWSRHTTDCMHTA